MLIPCIEEENQQLCCRGEELKSVSISSRLTTTCNIGAGMDKDIYQNKKHTRGGEDFSSVVGQTWVRLTPSV